MLIPRKTHQGRRALSGHLLAAALLLMAGTARAFVFLDTSGPQSAPAPDTVASKDHRIIVVNTADSAAEDPVPADTAAAAGPVSGTVGSTAVPSPTKAGTAGPHYGNVLFLSADSKMVYAYIGVLKALDEFGLAPDAVLAESKAVVVGAAWALGYTASGIERELLQRPLENYFRPLVAERRDGAGDFHPEGPDPLQWDFPLGLQSLQSSGSIWRDVRVGETGEFLHLSWMVARLTHDAPGGPVEDLAGTPRPLAVQVTDLDSEKGAVLTSGGLQNILKSSLLPADVVRARRRLWPFASGALLSGQSVMADRLPFTCDRILMVQPGHRLRPPRLEQGPTPWMDSLNLRARRNAAGSGPEGQTGWHGRTLVIELEPEGEFDPEERDPRRWISLGYTSALRSMDILKSALGRPAPAGQGPGGQGLGGQETDGRSPVATLDSPGRNGPEHLGLNRLSVNPLASGGRQLLLDILHSSEGEPGDSTGDAAISALVGSGFYTDLDLEWTPGADSGKAMLVFDAKEKSRIEFRAGYDLAFTGESIPDRAPELYGGLAWSEPFYIPFQADLGVVLGGHQPGYEARALIAPVFPLHMELGLTRTRWAMLYSFDPPKAARNLGAGYLRLDRILSEVFLKVFPFRGAYLRTAIQKHEMELHGAVDEGEPDFLSTDFQESGFLGLGGRNRYGEHPYSLRLRYRNLNRVNTFGQVRHATSSLESRLRIAWRDFRLTDQYFWSDQEDEPSSIYDIVEAGTIDAFTFQDEFFLRYLRSTDFQDVKLEYCPTFGKAGIRLIGGAFRTYRAIPFQGRDDYREIYGRKLPVRIHWEIQGGYATPLGTFRVGMGGLEDRQPFYYFRLGSGFNLGFEGKE